MAQSTTNPTRFFVDSTALLRTLSRYDPHTVPESAALFSGVVAIFSFGGISFDVGRRFLDVAQQLADDGAVDERVLYYRALRFLHHLLAGDWSEEHTIDPALVAEGIREGRFWEASTYLDLDCFRQVHQGDFAAAWDRIGQLAELVDLYEYDLASSARLFNTASLHVERREFDEALRALESYYDEHSEVLFNVLALGTRARVYALRGDAKRAAEEIARAESVMAQAGRVAPFHASAVHSARYLIDVLALERAVAAGHGAAPAARRARASRKAALATAAKVAWRRAEALRLVGRESWLRGRRAEGIAWWSRALDCATQLGAQPELARTLADAGRALSEHDGDLALQGRDAGTCLEQARELFDQMQLPVDRALVPDAT
jgi:tetratricopeptide (TPR) repeat protein